MEDKTKEKIKFVIEMFEVGPLQENCYIIYEENTKKAFLIDPGADSELILKKIKEHKLKPEKIINTHAHVDHLGAVYPLQKELNLPFYIHKSDLFLLDMASQNAEFLGLGKIEKPDVSGFLNDGEELDLAGIKIKVVHTPGHTPGGVCFYIKSEEVIFVGDTLFAGSVGRTDLPGGSERELIYYIKTRILVLGNSTKVYCGHGPSTTVGREYLSNPFLV